jgi:hypothetical protein
MLWTLKFLRRRFLKISNLGSCDLLMHQIGTIYVTFLEDYIWIIPIKFGKNPSYYLGDVVDNHKRLMMGRFPCAMVNLLKGTILF